MKIKQPKMLEEIPIACQFLNVFPNEVPYLPSMREIDFTIELIPGTALTSTAPYRMSPRELREPKV